MSKADYAVELLLEEIDVVTNAISFYSDLSRPQKRFPMALKTLMKLRECGVTVKSVDTVDPLFSMIIK